MKDTQPDLQPFIEAAKSIELQRAVLGDPFVDDALGQIRDRALSDITAPNEEQTALVSAWSKTVETMKSLGLTVSDPPVHIKEALDVTSTYEEASAAFFGLRSTIGEQALVGVTEAETSKVVLEPTIEPEKPVESEPEPTIASDQEIAQERQIVSVEPSDITNGIILNIDGKIKKTRGIRASMILDIIEATASGEEVGISQYLVDKFGTTSSALQRELGKSEQSGGTSPVHKDLQDTKNKISNFYGALGVLRELELIEHNKGQQATEGVQPISGTMKSNVAFKVSPELLERSTADQHTQAEQITELTASELILDHYLRTLNLGSNTIQIKSTKIGIDKTAALLRTIGELAAEKPSEKTAIKSKSILEHATANTPEFAPYNKTTLRKLRTTMAKLGEDSPLMMSGMRATATYAWQKGVAFIETDSMPDKPNFDNAIEVEINGSNILANIDGNHRLLEDTSSYNELQSRFSNTIDIERILQTDIKILEALSSLVATTDTIDTPTLTSLVIGENYTNNEQGYVRHRLNRLIDLINKQSDEDIVNERRFGDGSIYDLMRRIVIKYPNISVDSSTDDPQVGPTPVSFDDDKLLKPVSNDEGLGSELQLPVGPKKTAEQLLDRSESLDEKAKKKIVGRLLTGKAYPNGLDEAVFMLTELCNPETTEEIRETLFANQDRTVFNNFVAESLFKVYIRTRSWGDFGQLVRAARRRNGNKDSHEIVASVMSSIRRIENKDAAAIFDDSKSTSIAEFTERARTSLTDKKMIPPVKSAPQALAVIDLIRLEREAIVKNMTQAEYDQLVVDAHTIAQRKIGENGMHYLLEARRGKVVSKDRRAVLVGGSYQDLPRTDDRRFAEPIIK